LPSVALRWQTIPREALVWRDWEGEIVVYNGRTGNTHLLNSLCGLVLKRLYQLDSALSVQELTETIRLIERIEPLATTLIEEIGSTLEELRRFGLVQPHYT
jgi:PqqD family protein of HPr-rel-A system